MANSLDVPRPGRAEQDPERLLDDALATIAEVASACTRDGLEIAGVCLCSAMHGILALDDRMAPITPVVTWADRRAEPQAYRLRHRADALDVYGRTGTPLSAMAPLSKLLWFAEEDPQTFGRAAHWLSVKELLVLRLFGELVVDHSIASATGLFDLTRSDWDERLLSILDLDRKRLPVPVAVTEVFVGLQRADAARLGLDPGTPFVVGASDGALANLGSGAPAYPVATCTIGTSGALRTFLPAPRTDPKGRTFCYSFTRDKWLAGVAISNGGIALDWLADRILAGPNDPPGALGYEQMIDLAADATPGSEGLIFFPHLLGERVPRSDTDAPATFFGLTLAHGREHLARSVIEGVAYQLRVAARLLEEIAGPVSELRVGGGFTKASLVRQTLADVFDRAVVAPRDPESSCLGAAILGMAALDMIDSIEQAGSIVSSTLRYEPSLNAPIYAKALESFDMLDESFRLAHSRNQERTERTEA